MSKCFLLFILLFSANIAIGQCYFISDTLKYPVPAGHAEGGIAWIDNYKEIPCWYWIPGSPVGRRGFKYVYCHNGYYTDNKNTIGVVLDEKKKRVKKVIKYCFKEDE